MGLLADVARLRVGDLVLRALELRQQLRDERLDLIRVVDELGHVLDDARAVALGRGHVLVEAALEERAHDRERGAVNVLDEDAAGELVHALVRLLRLEDALDDVGDRGNNVLVVARVGDCDEKSNSNAQASKRR